MVFQRYTADPIRSEMSLQVKASTKLNINFNTSTVGTRGEGYDQETNYHFVFFGKQFIRILVILSPSVQPICKMIKIANMFQYDHRIKVSKKYYRKSQQKKKTQSMSQCNFGFTFQAFYEGNVVESDTLAADG
jgi:hypothetical protein